jgi:hypothetical protein
MSFTLSIPSQSDYLTTPLNRTTHYDSCKQIESQFASLTTPFIAPSFYTVVFQLGEEREKEDLQGKEDLEEKR